MADVVVVGAGVIGASVAYHLAKAGCRDVVVLDGREPGTGSTGRATGGFRAQFGSPINICLSLLARDKLLHFLEETGVDPGFRQHGYLFLASDPRTLQALLAAREIQRRTGLTETRIVEPDEIQRINPAVEMFGIVGGVFGPTDGFLMPMRILEGYRQAAIRLGVRFEFGRSCVGLERSGDRVSRVETATGPIPVGAVVNAAGAWAGELGRMAGVDIPVAPLRRQVAITRPFTGLPNSMPMTIFADDGFHFRVRDGRALVLWPHGPEPADPYDTRVDRGWFETVVRIARERVPVLERAEFDFEEAWGGLYEMSPDHDAILGRALGVENFFLVNGSSGHGVMHAPALGQLLAEIMLDGRTHTLDVHALRPERFAEGAPNTASVLL